MVGSSFYNFTFEKQIELEREATEKQELLREQGGVHEGREKFLKAYKRAIMEYLAESRNLEQQRQNLSKNGEHQI